ncbi:amidase [Mesorhizobium sp. B4-1-4]|uniref:amidase n=1 Tax=Mesorhizobium sp. B4-1-4 TaxID=2589888 RepID=UPI00112A2591|nr:amidase [Mesorhizobium sp. B4-1-4]
MLSGYSDLDGVGLADAIHKREVSATEVLETAIALTEQANEALNFVAVRCYGEGRKTARQSLPGSPLSGVPYLLKDSFTSWRDTVTTNGSYLYRNYMSPSDSETSRRARDGGLVMYAKSTTPEFAAGITTETPLHGATLNPWSLEHTPGGSTGGGAAAVAAGVVPLANASDAGGSIRIPAAYCGLVGHKPSRGRIPWGPDVLDVVGGLATEGCVSRTVRDQAAYLDLMQGNIPGDRDRPPAPGATFMSAIELRPEPLRIGFTVNSHIEEATYAPGVLAVQSIATLCESMGHCVEELSLGEYDYVKALANTGTIFRVDHYRIFRNARAMKGAEPCGQDFTRVMFDSARAGAAITGVEYADAVESLRQTTRRVELMMAPYDVIITPMSVRPPPAIGQNTQERTELGAYGIENRKQVSWFASLFNVTGQPACSVPAGFDDNGLPVAIQIVGKWGDDATVLKLATAIEAERPWISRKPKFWFAA